MNVHLIDGTFELFRCFYGAPKAADPSGREVGAVRGLIRTLWSLLSDEETTHVAVAFDRVIESFRNDMYDGYKTGAGIDPDLTGQFPIAERAARALGVVVWPMVFYEADDALATGALRYGDPNRRVLLCTPDKDMAQCVVDDRIVMVNRIQKKTLDEDAVRAKFGVSPQSIPDYLALVGDTADGIPGIPRWGARSAATVLARYGHIEQIPDNPEAWDVKVRGAKALAANLAAGRGEAALYRDLATLRTDVPLEEELEDLEWRGVQREALASLCEELGYERFLERVDRPELRS